MREFQLFLVFVVSLLCGIVVGKQCTNGGVGSSHSFRYELLKSNNETWKEEMSSHYHLIHTDDSFWADLMPRKMLKEDVFSWSMMYREMKNPSGFKVGGNFLKEVSLHDVELDPSSFHWRAQQTNLEYLLMLDVDRLVWSFRRTAGLETPGKSFGGWEETDSELRGHFVGHYLSATALTWASTHNETLKEKMSAVVSELSACQKKIDSGYLSAFPSELFDRFEALEPVWAPYYTIHKILAGLLDQYIFADNAEALNMTTWMVEYFYNRVENVIAKYSVERHWQSLNEETGGMNDVLYKLYAITGNMKHLALAHLFDKPCFLGPLALQADDISGFHSNTHIPIVIGAQMRYEVTGDPLYKTIGTYFMQIVNSSHSYATGGTSVGEFWSDPKRLASTLETENEESCTTYNMLKVSRHLFRWTKEMIYADYYERALTNGVLGIQRGTDPGVMIYMLPLGRGVSKAVSYHGWGTKFDSFWCCYGTGIESFSKLGDSIYFEEEGKVPGIYITQYISSTLDWKSGQLQVTQKVDPVVSWDPFLRISLSFAPKQGTARSSAVNLRIPTWTNLNGAKVELNGQNMPLPAPGKFLSITRKWSSSDKLTLQLPITLKTEAIKDDRPEYASIQAILYGPYLLAGHTTGDWDIKTGSDSSDWITPVPAAYKSHLVTFSQKSGNSTFALSSFNQSTTMQKLHGQGTIGAGSATFRVILLDTTKKHWTMKNAIGKTVKLEPFDLPGMLLVNQGDKTLGIKDSLGNDASSSFRLVAGLDGTSGSVSLESVSQKGCYVHGGVKYKSGLSVKLSCKGESPEAEMNRAASFAMKKGISEYHPISFVAKGVRRNFLMAPLMSFTDEFYSVYFNIQA